MTPVEERLRQLRATTATTVAPSPELLGRIREATGRPRRRRPGHAQPSRPARSSPPARLAALAMAGLAAVFAAATAGRSLSHHQPTVAPVAAPAVRARIPSSLIYQYAVANPGARHVTLISADGLTKVPVVVLPDGASVLGRGDLPILGRFETYQLWGIVGDQEISLRVVGANPDFISFTTPANVTMLFMTVEQEGGVVNSHKVPVVSGVVNSPADDGGGGDLRNGAVRSRVV